MNKKIILTVGMFLLLCSPVFATSVNFYYSENCPHCHSVMPLVVELSKYYPINFLDIAKGSYAVDGVPLIEILTNDKREIKLVGSQEIPSKLGCELNEVSSLECVTYSANEGYNTETQSWFIK